MPIFDSEELCKGQWTQGGALNFVMFRWCSKQEQAGLDSLLRVWTDLPRDIRVVCTREWGSPGGSYQMLAWCVHQQLTAAREADVEGASR